eukprot:7195761-Alexandrium_andersonii.AAC.1
MGSHGQRLHAVLGSILALDVPRGLRDALLGEAVRAAARAAVQLGPGGVLYAREDAIVVIDAAVQTDDPLGGDGEADSGRGGPVYTRTGGMSGPGTLLRELGPVPAFPSF